MDGELDPVLQVAASAQGAAAPQDPVLQVALEAQSSGVPGVPAAPNPDDAILAVAAHSIAATPRTFGGELKTAVTEARAVPWVGSAIEGKGLYDAVKASHELERTGWDGLSPQSKAKLLDVWAQGQREGGFGSTVGSILANLPGYAVSFAATMPAHALVKGAFERGAEKVIGKAVRDKVEEMALRKGIEGLAGKLAIGAGKAVATAVGAAAQVPLQPQMIATEAFQQQLKEAGLHFSEDEAQRMRVDLSAAVPSLWDVMDSATRNAFAETFGEHSGAMFTGLNKLSFKLVARAMGASGEEASKAAGHWLEHLEKYGWHGLGESFEERITEVLRGDPVTTGVTWKDGQLHVDMNEVKQLAAELVSFTAPTLVMQGLEREHQLVAGQASTQVHEAPQESKGPLAAEPLRQAMAGIPTASAEPSVESESQRTEQGPPAPTPGVGGAPTPGVPPAPMHGVPLEVQKAGESLARFGGGGEVARVSESTKDDFWERAARARGVPVYEVDAGKPLRAQASYKADSILIDVHASESDRREALMLHELVHAMKDAAGGSFEALAQSLPPEWLQRSETEYAAARQAATGRGPSSRLSSEEGVAHLVENMPGVVQLAMEHPERIVAAVRGSFWQNLLDGVLEMGKSLGIKMRTFREKRLRALRDEVATGRYEKEMDADLALTIGHAVAEAFKAMQGATKQLSSAPKVESKATIETATAEGAPTDVGNVREAGGGDAQEPGPVEVPAAEAGAEAGPAPAAAAAELVGRGAEEHAGPPASEPAAGGLPGTERAAEAGRSDKQGARKGRPRGQRASAAREAEAKPTGVESERERLIREEIERAYAQPEEKKAAPGPSSEHAERAASQGQPAEELPPEEPTKVTWTKAKIVPTREGVKTEVVEGPHSMLSAQDREAELADLKKRINRMIREHRTNKEADEYQRLLARQQQLLHERIKELAAAEQTEQPKASIAPKEAPPKPAKIETIDQKRERITKSIKGIQRKLDKLLDEQQRHSEEGREGQSGEAFKAWQKKAKQLESQVAERTEALRMTQQDLDSLPKPEPRPDGLNDKQKRLRDAFDELLAVEPFDQEKYEKLKPHLHDALLDLPETARADERSIVRAMVEYLRDTLKLAKEKVLKAIAYIDRFATEAIETFQKKRPAPEPTLPPNTASLEVKPYNYEITDADLDFQGAGAKSKARANIDAIRLLRDLESQGRNATVEEKKRLVRYVGWGDTQLANGIFPDPVSGEFKDEWREMGLELRALLSDEEYRQASASTRNAHYTSKEVVTAIWSALQRLGFKGGKVLEPGMGVGGFLGLAPKLEKGINYFGIELDPITARIATRLYGQATVRNASYTEIKLPHNHFDAAVGNPPFGQETIQSDPEYRAKNFPIHNYFFAKSIERVRPGGVLAFVTSRYTMDSQDPGFRRWMSERAQFVGAIRLPKTAFKQNAGTEVVTDILFFRRLAPGEKAERGPWEEAHAGTRGGNYFVRNAYFDAHPEMVLGREALTGSMYRDREYTVEPSGDLGKQLAHAVAQLPQNVYREAAPVERKGFGTKSSDLAERLKELAPETIKEGGYYIGAKGRVFQKREGQGLEVQARAKGVQGGVAKGDLAIIESFIPLRDAVRAVLAAQLRGGDSADEQKALRKAYDAFVNKHGIVNRRVVYTRQTKEGAKEYYRFPTLSAFDEDPDAQRVAALEKVDENGKVALADIFTKNVVKPPLEAEPKTPQDAVFVVLNRTGKVDLYEAGKLIGKSAGEMEKELGDAVFQDPESSDYVLADRYLSGNVKAKLRQAEAHVSIEPKYQRNVEALRAVQPADIPHTGITATLGSHWIPLDDYRRFMVDVLGLAPRVRIMFSQEVGAWKVDGESQDNTLWGTTDYRSDKILAHALNGKDPVVKVKVEDGESTKEVVEPERTAAAREKVAKMREAFVKWVWEDEERRNRLAAYYNENFNTDVPWKPDGSHLTLPGSTIQLRKWQKNVVWRILQSGNTYMAHAVGAGKTMAMVAAGMEMKRLGIARKVAYAVPNHMLRQFSNELLQLYPAANILVADEENFSAQNRRRFQVQTATGNWDAVILTHSSLSKVPLSGDYQAKLLAEETRRMFDALAGLPPKSKMRKEIERKIATREQRIAKLQADEKKDKTVTWEELGIDALFVDEAHEFRRMDIATERGRVKGINTQGSARSWDLYTKSRYLESINPGRSLVLASGTPVTNTIGELYTLQRFMQESRLRELGLQSFDAWANMFGQTTEDVEMNAGGQFKIVSRFARFTNLPELSRILSQVMDIVTSDDLARPDEKGNVALTRPQIEGGRRQIVATPASAAFREYQQQLLAEMEKARGKEKGRIFLSVIRRGRFAAIDLRTVVAGAKNDPNSKLNRVIADVFKAWEETKEQRLTQMIFCDLQEAGKEATGFNIYDWITSELVRQGVPRAEIAQIQQVKSLEEKAALFRRMNAGEVRILMGGKGMETGVNAQVRLKTLSHIDAPWYPASMTQREGRIYRQGNTNKTISIKAYATERSYDATMWQLLEIKQKFIEQLLRGDLNVREAQDIGGESASFALAKAMATGDNRVIEMVGLERDVERLSQLQRAHHEEHVTAQRNVLWARSHQQEAQARADRYKAALAEAPELEGDKFKITVGSEELAERKVAGEKLLRAALDVQAPEKAGTETKQTVGSVGPFRIEALASLGFGGDTYRSVRVVAASGAMSEATRVEEGESPLGLVQSVVSKATSGWETLANRAQGEIEKDQRDIDRNEQVLKGKFGYGSELEQKSQRLRELMDALQSEDQKNAPIAESEEENLPDESDDEERLAVAPEDRARIGELSEQAREEGEDTQVGRTPYRRTPLGEDELVRANMRAIDQWRHELGRPEPVPIEAQERRAEEELDQDREGTIAALESKLRSGVLLHPWEMKAVARVIQQRMFTNDESWMELGDMLRDNRAQVSRSLGVLRDPMLQSMSGRELMIDLLSVLSRQGRRKVARIKRMLAQPGLPAARELVLRQELAKVLKGEAAKTNEAKAKLMKAGFPPALISADYFRDPVTRGRIVRIVMTTKNNGVWDWAIEYMQFAMLSGPLTQKANLVGNLAFGTYNIHLRRLVEILTNLAFREKGAAQPEELRALWQVQKEAWVNAGRYWAMAMQSELPAFESFLAEQGVDVAGAGGIASKLEEFERGPSIPGAPGRAMRAVSLTMLLANDEATKALFATQEGAALAIRAAKAEGVRGAAALEQRAREILSDFTHPVHFESLVEAKQSLFQGKHGAPTQVALKLRAWLDDVFGGIPVGTILFPYVTTPLQIFKSGLVEAGMPLIFLARAGRSVATREGPYRGNRPLLVKDTAHAISSSLLALGVYSLVAGNAGGDDEDLPLITGSGSGDWRADERGAPPYSIYIAGRYRSYARVEPMSVGLATLVDAAHAVRNAASDGPGASAQAALSNFVHSVIEQASDKTFLQTFSMLYDAAQSQTPTKVPVRMSVDLASRLVPNIIRQPLAYGLPQRRESGMRVYDDAGIWKAGFTKSLPQRLVPVEALSLPPRYDLWGREVPKYPVDESPAMAMGLDLVSPLTAARAGSEVSKLDRLILRYNERVALGLLPGSTAYHPGAPPTYWQLPRAQGGNRIYWSDEEYQRLCRDAGQDAAQRLSKLGLNYLEPTDRDKQRIEEVVAYSRENVRRALLRERQAIGSLSPQGR